MTETASTFALAIRRAAGVSEEDWPDEMVAMLRNVVGTEAPTWVMGQLIVYKVLYGLDPLLRQIWGSKIKGKWTILTGRDTFVHLGQKHEAYRGHQTGVVHEGEKLEIKRLEDGRVVIDHRITIPRSTKILGAYSAVRMEGRPDTLVVRAWDDYKKLQGRDLWKEQPDTMMEARVLTAAHRQALSIGGLYTPEEFDNGGDRPEPEEGTSLEELNRRFHGAEEVPVEAEEAEGGAEVPEADYEVVEGDQEPPAPIVDEEEIERLKREHAIEAEEAPVEVTGSLFEGGPDLE